jgi:hypothetical protein
MVNYLIGLGVGGWGETKQTHNNREVVARSWTQQLTGMDWNGGGGRQHNIREVLAWKLGPFAFGDEDSLRL